MATKQWNFKIQWPTDSDYQVRITDITFGPSKRSGNPMLTVSTEVISPDEKEVAGEMIGVSGVNPQDVYLTTKNLKDEGKSAYSQERLKEWLSKAFPNNPEIVKGFNFENPDQAVLNSLKGTVWFVSMNADKQEMRKEPTKAQVEEAAAKGIDPVGSVMVNPITGEPLVSYRPKINDWFGLAPTGAGAGKPF